MIVTDKLTNLDYPIKKRKNTLLKLKSQTKMSKKFLQRTLFSGWREQMKQGQNMLKNKKLNLVKN